MMINKALLPIYDLTKVFGTSQIEPNRRCPRERAAGTEGGVNDRDQPIAAIASPDRHMARSRQPKP
jgi:hypothetical protein